MSEIKKVYRQEMPKMKLVGRCYHECDKVNGTFSAIWGEWFERNIFAPISNCGGEEPFEDASAYIGMSICKADGSYEYWIGVFLPLEFVVPQGYDSITLEAGSIAVCWVYGTEPDIYMHCCLSRLAEEGYSWSADENGTRIMFERYTCPRFTDPDAQGNRILDSCYYIK